MKLTSNKISQSDTAVLTLSGFASDVKSDTVQRIFDGYEKQGVAAYSFAKPGHKGSMKRKFSLGETRDNIAKSSEEILSMHRDIIYIGNSFTALPFLEAANLLKDNVKQILLLSPVFCPETAMKNKFFTEGIRIDRIDEAILPTAEKATGVSIDSKRFLEEKITLISPQTRNKIFSNISEKTQVFLNPRDRIIDRHLVKAICRCYSIPIQETSSIDDDTNHHAIPIDEVFAHMQSKQAFVKHMGISH